MAEATAEAEDAARAESPWRLPARAWLDVAKRVKRELSEDHVALVSAGVAFYLMLALFPALIALLTLVGLAMVYRYGPNRADARWQWVTPGALVAALLWFLGTIAFSLYVSYFGNFNETYGTLGGVIVLLLWLFITAYSVILGAEVNVELERTTARDTTTGKPRPMGARGAKMADEVARPNRTPAQR